MEAKSCLFNDCKFRRSWRKILKSRYNWSAFSVLFVITQVHMLRTLRIPLPIQFHVHLHAMSNSHFKTNQNDPMLSFQFTMKFVKCASWFNCCSRHLINKFIERQLCEQIKRIAHPATKEKGRAVTVVISATLEPGLRKEGSVEYAQDLGENVHLVWMQQRSRS